MTAGFWDWFHDVSTAVLVLTVFLTLDTVLRLQRRVRAIEQRSRSEQKEIR